MTLSSFPTLIGKTWDIKKEPVWNTRKLVARNGLQYRAANWSYPLWQFDCAFSVLRTGAAYLEYQTMVGFINSLNGMYAPFLYDDPFDDTATAQALGVGNSSQVAFPLLRTLGGFTEPILYCSALNNVYLNGVLQSSSNYSLTQTGTYGPDTLTFNSAPTTGVAVTADFNFDFVCSLTEDETEMNNFMNGYWELKSIKFLSLKD